MRLAVVLLTSHVLLLVHCATCHSPVRDELVRLRAGREHWETGVFRADPGNPPLVDMCAALPLFVGSACGGTGESPPRPLGANIESKWMVPSRWALIPFSVCGGVVCFCWARSLFGAAAGLFALLMWSCDPLILAHGALITGDVVATTTGIAASYVFWRWMQNPITKHAATAGAGLGVALISKYVWVIMVPIWFTLWLVQRLKKPTSRLRQDAWHSCVAGAVALYVVNLGFGFEESFQPISSFEFQNPGMGWLSSVSGYDTDTGDPGAISWLPVPLPRNYVMGIDAIASHVAIVDRATYVHDDFVESNVWYFYLFGLLVKMPLGTWLLLAVAVYARLTSPKRQFERSEPLETDATGRNARSCGCNRQECLFH